ncbi:MAG TPA: nucleotidyltransferase [Vicinamibacteria bacterium]|nr:nucleotidyltransferase [Vicinamibacteria bacterium]
MSIQPAALELLADLSKVLASWGRWYVFGAQAVIAYGVPRLSADVDVTVELVPEEPERFAADMKAAGFELRVDDPDFVRRTRVMPFVHLATAMPLDVVLAASGLEDEFLDRARNVKLGSTTVPLIDPEDLIIAKLLAGRPKDVEDAQSLWRIRGAELDGERIRRTLRKLEEALSQSDLVSAFESLRRS